ncbi:metallophosphoesterase, partial [Brevundimonas denitrificans]
MLIAQITDTHIKAAGKLAYRRVDTAASLARVIDHVNGFTPAVDAVILSGDLTDAGRPEEFELLLHHLGRLKAPWYVIPGNHDKADTFRKAFAGTRYQPDDLPFYQYVVDDHP